MSRYSFNRLCKKLIHLNKIHKKRWIDMSQGFSEFEMLVSVGMKKIVKSLESIDKKLDIIVEELKRIHPKDSN